VVAWEAFWSTLARLKSSHIAGVFSIYLTPLLSRGLACYNGIASLNSITMQFFTFSLFVALAARAAAVPRPANLVVHERHDAAPKEWIKRGRLHGDAKLPVRIGMTQSNLDKGHELLMEV
jgi:Pro-kumamolisin, activation domain